MSFLSAIFKKSASKNIGSEYDDMQLWTFGPILRRTGEDAIKEWCRVNKPKLLEQPNVGWHTYTIGEMKRLLNAPGDSSMISQWLNENEYNIVLKAGSGLKTSSSGSNQSSSEGLWVPGESNKQNSTTAVRASPTISDYGYNSYYVNGQSHRKTAEAPKGTDIYTMGTVSPVVKDAATDVKKGSIDIFSPDTAKQTAQEPIKVSKPAEVYHRPPEAVREPVAPIVRTVPDKQIVHHTADAATGTTNNYTVNIGSINIYVKDTPLDSRKEKMALQLTDLKDITPTADVKIEASAAKKPSRFAFLSKLNPFKKEQEE